ncbi:hypothetical protein ACFFRR_011104 [Megaselia abdita]
MKFLFVLALVLVGVYSESGVIYRGNARHPDFPNQCYYKDGEKPLKFDENYRPIGECLKIKCRDDYVLGINYCSRYHVPQMCEEIKEDLTKAFPNCCPKLKCKDKDGKESIRETTFDSDM